MLLAHSWPCPPSALWALVGPMALGPLYITCGGFWPKQLHHGFVRIFDPTFPEHFSVCNLCAEMVGERFGNPFWGISDKVQNCCQMLPKIGLENTKLVSLWIVMAPFGLARVVSRGTGPKFHFKPLFGHIGPPGGQNRPFSGFWGQFRLLASPWPIVAYCPCGRRHGRSLLICLWGLLGQAHPTPTGSL